MKRRLEFQNGALQLHARSAFAQHGLLGSLDGARQSSVVAAHPIRQGQQVQQGRSLSHVR